MSINVLFRNIMRRKGRSAMTIAAVAISMSLLISMLSVAEGIIKASSSEIEQGNEDILVTAGGAHGVENGHAFAKALDGYSGVSYSAPILGSTVSFATNKGMMFAYAEGVIPREAWRLMPTQAKEKFEEWFSVDGDPHYEGNFTGNWTNEILISKSIASKFHLGKGSTLNVSKSSNGPQYVFKVVGVFNTEFMSDGAIPEMYLVIMHLSELQSILGYDLHAGPNGTTKVIDLVDSISLMLESGVKSDLTKTKKLIKEIETDYPAYKNKVLTKDERIEAAQRQVAIARGFYTAIGSVSVLIGLLFVTCIMILSIFERSKEIGMQRAIGISKLTIFTEILLESMLLVTIGAFIGLGPGYFGSVWLSNYLTSGVGLDVELAMFTPQLILQSLFITILIGSITSLFPAWSATRVSILKTLKRI